jgi:hypothetical protein
VAPAVEGIAGAQGGGAAMPDVLAVVLDACVELFGASPGNCMALSGLTEAEALIGAFVPSPLVAVDRAVEPIGADPVVPPVTVPIAEPVSAGEVGTLKGSLVQPAAVAAPAADTPDVVQGAAAVPVPVEFADAAVWA